MKLYPIYTRKRHNAPYRLAKAIKSAGVFLGLLVALNSCDIINPDEPIPAYIRINNINLSVNPVIDGSSSGKITDAWVYADGSLVGVYELPCLFPVLKEGEHDIIVKAGIKMNGINGSRAYYPFYTDHEQRVNLVPGETHTLTPSVTYYNNKVHYREGFEDGGISFEKLGVSDTTVVKTTSDVFEGVFSGLIALDELRDYVLVATTAAYELPKNSTPVFLEMNYKTNNPFSVGLYASVNGQLTRKDVMIVNKNESWNKIYINLTYACASEQSADNFKLFFEANKDADVSNAIILLDNLKLVYN